MKITANPTSWAVLGELRAILTGAGQELPKPSEKSFVKEGEILKERGLKRALAEREEALRELATAARWVDRSAFKEEAGFAQAHQAFAQSLGRSGRSIEWFVRMSTDRESN